MPIVNFRKRLKKIIAKHNAGFPGFLGWMRAKENWKMPRQEERLWEGENSSKIGLDKLSDVIDQCMIFMVVDNIVFTDSTLGAEEIEFASTRY